jgi:hypothetical protein
LPTWASSWTTVPWSSMTQIDVISSEEPDVTESQTRGEIDIDPAAGGSLNITPLNNPDKPGPGRRHPLRDRAVSSHSGLRLSEQTGHKYHNGLA